MAATAVVVCPRARRAPLLSPPSKVGARTGLARCFNLTSRSSLESLSPLSLIITVQSHQISGLCETRCILHPLALVPMVKEACLMQGVLVRQHMHCLIRHEVCEQDDG